MEEVRYRDDVGFLADWSRALSRGGVFVNTRRMPRAGQSIAVRLSYPDRDLSVQLEGRVLWKRTSDNEENLPPGVFVTLDPRDDDVTERLRELADRLAGEGVEPLFAPACWNPEGFDSESSSGESGEATTLRPRR